MLTIYKASAGSGKTHTLTREYLRLALQSEYGYERIQAVTFTNKATEEMKERITRELYRITKGREHSPFFDELCGALNLSAERLKLQAERVLRRILLDYSAFRISTIDAFFQEIVRAFSRELGLQGGYRVDLEEKAALDSAVTAVLSEQENSGVIQSWIKSISHALVNEGEGFDLYKHLRKLASTLLSEEVKQLALSKQIPTRQQLGDLDQSLSRIIEGYVKQVVDIAQSVMQALHEQGLSIEDTSYGASGALGVFHRQLTKEGVMATLSGGDPLPSRLIKALEDPSTIFKKGSPHRDWVTTSKVPGLLSQYYELVRTGLFMACSAIVARQELGSYGLISDIESKLNEQQRSAGSILLADTPALINKILQDDGGGAFIYEKIGTRIDHQMIDEFQDTSTMQYLDFLPLLEESLAAGHSNLVVGDVKQSIYRWRGSDSALLGTRINEDFKSAQTITLQDNWRSSPEVIAFNNALYKHASALISQYFLSYIAEHAELNPAIRGSERLSQLAQRIEAYYADVEQSVPASRQGRRGQVVLHELQADNPAEEDGDAPTPAPTSGVADVLIDLQRRGYSPSDIAILVRTGRQAKLIAQELAAASTEPLGATPQGVPYSLDIISAEALEVGNALSVRFIISALHFVATPKSLKAQHTLGELWRVIAPESAPEELERLQNTLIEAGRRSLYETIESIIAHYGERFSPCEEPYIIKLLDMALGYQQDLAADIADFLSMWERTGKSRTLNTSEDKSKIHLMTIHKAKGLGFPVVLLPFPTWSLERDNPREISYLWCDSPFSETFGIGKLPIAYGKGLLRTAFAPSYIAERIALSVDALNLLYVATTRAESELHLWLSGTETSAEPSKVSDLIASFLQQYPSLVRRSAEADYVDGAPLYTPRPTPPESFLSIERIQSYEASRRIEVLRKGLAHFSDDTPRAYGSLMHDILDDIKTLADVQPALERAIQAGKLSPDQAAQALQALDHLLTTPEAKPWFDGSGEVLREAAIVGGGLQTSRRPDRVLLYPDGSAVVIDYKFGKLNRRYGAQVRRYMRLLQSMGYAPVRGYLWYLSDGRIEPITLPEPVR